MNQEQEKTTVFLTESATGYTKSELHDIYLDGELWYTALTGYGNSAKVVLMFAYSEHDAIDKIFEDDDDITPDQVAHVAKVDPNDPVNWDTIDIYEFREK